MSLIYKNHLVFPIFRHQETITSPRNTSIQNESQLPQSTSRKQCPPRLRPINLTSLNNNESSISTQTAKKRLLPIITPRPKQEESNLQAYLDHLHSLRQTKSPSKHQEVLKKIRTETEIMKMESQSLILRFKKAKEQQQEKKAILMKAVKNPFAQQYINFSKQIFNLIHCLHQLKEYLNNSRKMYQVVKSLIGMKKNLKKILLKQSNDELIDFQDIAKNCCVREIQYINGEQRIVDKFDLSLLEDLVYMSEAIENLLLQNQLNAVKRMSDNIKVEENEISKLRKQLGMPDIEHKLSLQTHAMKRFRPHTELDNIEQRLGQFTQIPKQNRQTSSVLCNILDQLNQ